MRNLIFIIVILTITGCGSKKWQHEIYGTGDTNNKQYVENKKECEYLIYSKGVEINGTKTTDIEVIEKYDLEYSEWIREYLKQRLSTVGASTGLQTSLALQKGHNLPPYNNSSNSNFQIPEKYNDIVRAGKEITQCLNEKGWNFK